MKSARSVTTHTSQPIEGAQSAGESRGARGQRPRQAYIGAAYFFTSSTSFANPAISIGRMFSNTFAGIAPGSVPGYLIAQLVGGAVALIAIRSLYPDIEPADAQAVVLPHPA